MCVCSRIVFSVMEGNFSVMLDGGGDAVVTISGQFSLSWIKNNYGLVSSIAMVTFCKEHGG